MKTKKRKKYKKYIIMIILFSSIYITYKYLESKKVELTDKELINIVVNNTFKEDNIVKKVMSQNYSNPILLLNESYKEVTENNNSTKPIVYLYNSHPTEEYKSSNIGEYYINPTVIMNNYILEGIFNKRGYKTYVEEESVKDI